MSEIRDIYFWINEAILELESTDDGVTDREGNAVMLLNYALKAPKNHSAFGAVTDNNSDKRWFIEAVNNMCVESLSPEGVEKWHKVVLELISTRPDLKGIGYDIEKSSMDIT